MYPRIVTYNTASSPDKLFNFMEFPLFVGTGVAVGAVDSIGGVATGAMVDSAGDRVTGATVGSAGGGVTGAAVGST